MASLGLTQGQAGGSAVDVSASRAEAPLPQEYPAAVPCSASPCPSSGHIRGELTGGWPSKAGEWSTDTLAPENVSLKRLVYLWASVSPSVKGTTRLDSLQVFSGLQIPMHLILNFIYQ